MILFSQNKIQRLIDHIAANANFLRNNCQLNEILEGELLPKVKSALKKQLGPEAYSAAEPRIPPINVLQQVNDKLSTIYENGVQRSSEKSGKGSAPDSDNATLAYMTETMDPDTYFAEANKLYNLNKGVLIQPYISEVSETEVVPAMRVIPYDMFLPYSERTKEPEKPTGFVLMMGKEKRNKISAKTNKKTSQMIMVDVYYAVEADQFCWFTSDGENITAEKSPGNPEGVSDLGVIPYVYVNQSKTKLIPKIDTDVLAMTILLPVLLTDVNFGAAFQAFGIIYTLNVKTGKLNFGPGAVWHFQQDGTDERKPEINTLKVSCDIDAMLNSIANQYALWLQTKGIKPGSVGDINASNFTSGISKMLDEMDTSSNRKKQVPVFARAESEFWVLVLRYMLPAWRNQYGSFLKYNGTWNETSFVKTTYPEQVPLQRRGAIVTETKAEQDAEYIDYRTAMKRLHPTATDKKIDDIIGRIKKDKLERSTTNESATTETVDEPPEGGDGQPTD